MLLLYGNESFDHTLTAGRPWVAAHIKVQNAFRTSYRSALAVFPAAMISTKRPLEIISLLSSFADARLWAG